MDLQKAIEHISNIEEKLIKKVGIKLRFTEDTKKDLAAAAERGGYFGFLKEIPIVLKDDILHYQFYIGILPGLCGTMYFTRLSSNSSYIWCSSFFKQFREIDRSNIMQGILEVIKDIAVLLNFSNIICSNLDEDFDFRGETDKESFRSITRENKVLKFNYNLLQFGFTRLNSYDNKRSRNYVTIFNYNI